MSSGMHSSILQAAGTPLHPESSVGSPYSMAVQHSEMQWALQNPHAAAAAGSNMPYAGMLGAGHPTAADDSGLSSCSTPSSHKRHSKPKWLQNVLKYATPKGRKNQRSMQQEQQQQQQAAVLQQQQYCEQQLQEEQHALLQQELQEQMQIQMEYAQHEAVAFEQQYYEQGWDKLPEHLQQQLKEQFHAEFLIQLQQQQELQELSAAYPDIDPALLQEQLVLQRQQQMELQESSTPQRTTDPAQLHEQTLQYEQLQQQLAGLQLPEHVQSLIQQHQLDGQDAAPLQTQNFAAYAAPAAAEQDGEEGAVVHVLDSPTGQVVQVSQNEFQDILTVMQALAGAYRCCVCNASKGL